MNAAGPRHASVISSVTAALLPAAQSVMLSASRTPYCEASASLRMTFPLGIETVSPPSGTPLAHRAPSYQSPVCPFQLRDHREVVRIEPPTPNGAA
jgi:hypothetical protein